jgi:hypothetical protein
VEARTTAQLVQVKPLLLLLLDASFSRRPAPVTKAQCRLLELHSIISHATAL